MNERTLAEFIIDKAFELYEILVSLAGMIDTTVGEALGLGSDDYGDLGIFQAFYEYILDITFFDFVVFELVLFMVIILLRHFLR